MLVFPLSSIQSKNQVCNGDTCDSPRLRTRFNRSRAIRTVNRIFRALEAAALRHDRDGLRLRAARQLDLPRNTTADCVGIYRFGIPRHASVDKAIHRAHAAARGRTL